METIESIPEGTGSSGYLFHEIPGTNQREGEMKREEFKYD